MAQRPDRPSAQGQPRDISIRVTDWKEQRSAIVAVLDAIERDRLTLLARLEAMGVRSTFDASADPQAEILLEELRDVLQQRTLLVRKLEKYDLAILHAESRLRILQRREAVHDAGITDAELMELAWKMAELDETLAAENQAETPVELDEVLEQQLRDANWPAINRTTSSTSKELGKSIAPSTSPNIRSEDRAHGPQGLSSVTPSRTAAEPLRDMRVEGQTKSPETKPDRIQNGSEQTHERSVSSNAEPLTAEERSLVGRYSLRTTIVRTGAECGAVEITLTPDKSFQLPDGTPGKWQTHAGAFTAWLPYWGLLSFRRRSATVYTAEAVHPQFRVRVRLTAVRCL